jgi:hypothetical protein
MYSELEYHVDVPGEHRLTEGGGGLSLQVYKRGLLRLVVEYGCIGPTPYTLALGVLRDPKDSLSAQQGHETRNFETAMIPARFHPDGVAVYAVLKQGAADVVAKTPNHHTVYKAVFAGAHGGALLCHGDGL